jgi:hypothetical protein
LKEDFQSHGNGRRQQRVYFTFHMGFQDQKYWILSKQVKFHILVYILKEGVQSVLRMCEMFVFWGLHRNLICCSQAF